MGTHPIFESDFDCLTAIMGGLCLYSQYSGCICGTVKSADYVIASFNEVKCSAEYAAKPSVGNCSPSKCGRTGHNGLWRWYRPGLNPRAGEFDKFTRFTICV